ncbi:uroporphyrinogen decarboxylase family protein [Atopococcus tabaci]|uniref:uroporphyrinogen decarboxylase family protein n=1 Tax=Atopococcus tabaci TaxID=269774 RepID=UPI000488AF83|nr:uroporphyrinogen decarboxylase family protein [Atopococcus tabaci]
MTHAGRFFCHMYPISFWTHVPEKDRNPEQIAEETYALFKKYDLDFIKTMNNGMYAVEDYGCRIDFSEVAAGGVAKVVETPIQSYEDWADVPEMSIEEGALAHELKHLELVLQKIDEEAPVIMTVFSPLTTADKLSQGKLKEHLAIDEASYVHQALKNIAATTAALSAKAIEMGAAGVYFASQMSSYEKLSEEAYRTYGVPYDLQVLEGAEKGWFNALHAHGNDSMFSLLKDYPVDVFNWHVWETLPELKEGMAYTQKCVMGGIARMDVTHDRRNQLRHQIYRSITETKGKHLILTPGCGIRHPFSKETIRFLQQVKKETEALL